MGTPENEAMTLKFKVGQDFCSVHLPTKFNHPMFNHSEVIVLINKLTHPQKKNKKKQADFVKNIHLATLCYASDELQHLRKQYNMACRNVILDVQKVSFLLSK